MFFEKCRVSDFPWIFSFIEKSVSKIVIVLFIIQEAIATSEEVGRDLEHVEVLQKKFEDFLKDIQANESRVTYINELAHQLGDEGHPDIELISTKQAVRS